MISILLLVITALINYQVGSLPYPEPAPFHPPSTAERIIQNGYAAEKHEVLTEDGYILTVFRIPRGFKLLSSAQKPLLLQHGILCSSDCWVLNGPTQGLGYILADAGYDVWLGNNRGNIYSRSHKKYAINQKEFWNFSFHEMGYYDLPAIIDYILKETAHESLVYIGHSQGTSVFFVMASSRPQYNKKLKVMGALGPVVYLNNTRGVVKSLAKLSNWLIDVSEVLSLDYVLDRSSTLALTDHLLCKVDWELCNDFVTLIAGPDLLHLDKDLIPYLADICPTGASTKQLIHFNQLMQTGKFSYYDYENKNDIVYNSSVPPEYNISAISIPVLLYYGGNDYISTSSEVKRLYNALGSEIKLIEISSFNHLDFMWSIDAKSFLYNNVIQMINKY